MKLSIPSRTQFVLKHLSGNKILDIGNLGEGGGYLHKSICQYCKNTKKELYSIDIDVDSAISSKFPNQVIGFAEHLPFKSGIFDSVYLGEIIEHTWEPLLIAKEVVRVLRNGGTLVLDTPNVYSLARIIRYLVLGKDYLGDPTHKIFYTPIILSNLLKFVGFEIVEITTDAKINLGFSNINIRFLRVPPFSWLGSHLCVAAKLKGDR